MQRRAFLKASAFSGGAAVALAGPLGNSITAAGEQQSPIPRLEVPLPTGIERRAKLPDFSPARWIWYPSERTLPNTFVLFRRELVVTGKPRRVTGWLAADSRYRLEVNGRRIQWGPAPSDPRWPEADPVDLTRVVWEGRNVLGVTVLYYGLGDGTWPIGKPGFLFWLEIEYVDGTRALVVSDAEWTTHVDRAWRPGHYKRWFLRALQEEFDARRHPFNWTSPFVEAPRDWLPAMVLPGLANKPALSAGYSDYLHDLGGGPPDTELRPRSIPMLHEGPQFGFELREMHRVEWLRSPEEYFEFRTPNAFRATKLPLPENDEPPGLLWPRTFTLDGESGLLLTYALPEQVVGWPTFTVKAPPGTVIELLVHEAHQSGGPPLLNTHFDSWTRFICSAGEWRFETFDFESFRWMQLHLHGSQGPVTISDLQVLRRVFPWPNRPILRTQERALQRLFDASVNTLHNCAQETLVDGMARERQQYSGDGGHQLHAVHLTFGETRLPARYLTTFSQGMTKDGYFLDCWPAYDRLARLMERQLDLSGWGPLLDHGTGFMFDCWHHYRYTADQDALREPYPRLVRFARYLQDHLGPDDLLPVEDLGVPSVWIDHVAYQRQRHKQCAFNLYVSAMFEHALADLSEVFGDGALVTGAREFGRRLRAAVVERFWSAERGLFVNNLPWLDEERAPRLCDRSLATAVLFDQCPGGNTEAAVRVLADCPPEMGFSYPCNAGWRLWALAKGARADVIVRDLRTRWATMASVAENNTLQEDWEARPDSGQQWSHCAVVPLYAVYHGLAGLQPLEPGFRRVELRPQLADLEHLEFTVYTVRGPVQFAAFGRVGARELVLGLPPGSPGELVLPDRESVALAPAATPAPRGCRRWLLPEASTTKLSLKYT